MKIPTLEILIGISGSGKSTYANSKKGFTIISTDNIREELFGDPSIQDNGKLVFQIAYDRLKDSLQKGNDTIFDATNLKLRDRKNLLNYLSNSNISYDVVYIVFTTALDECIERASKREINPISEDIVRKQHSKLHLPQNDELSMITDIKYI